MWVKEMRFYADVPIWLRPTDWENPYAPDALADSEKEELLEMRRRGLSFNQMAVEWGISKSSIQRLFRKYWGNDGRIRTNRYG